MALRMNWLWVTLADPDPATNGQLIMDLNLASGRPVVLQDTGFSDVLPTGEGLLAFRTPEEAAAQIRRVTADRERHRRAARALAEEHLDSDRVLTDLLERAL